jgi:hypothetical protein
MSFPWPAPAGFANLRDQLLGAAAESAVLNIAEGAGLNISQRQEAPLRNRAGQHTSNAAPSSLYSATGSDLRTDYTRIRALAIRNYQNPLTSRRPAQVRRRVFSCLDVITL